MYCQYWECIVGSVLSGIDRQCVREKMDKNRKYAALMIQGIGLYVDK